MSTAEVSPPWGAFPAEQYLLRHWDASSAAPSHDQRRQLIRDYLALRDIPQEWDATGRERPRGEMRPLGREPTPEEINDILAPWRPPPWRAAAFRIWTARYDEAIWLRTHYGGGGDGGDAAFRAWCTAVQEDYDPAFDEDALSWCVLDDAGLLAPLGGDGWERVLDLVPELAGPVQGYRRGVDEGSDEVRRLRAAVWAAEDRDAEAETGAAGMGLQVQAVATFLLVADREAWDTERLRLLYLDAWGNIVRHSRIRPEDVFETRHQWMGKKFRDCNWWLDEYDESGLRHEPGGQLGEKYRARGTVGRMLYGLE